jgi:RNA-directed DNA polymerase
VTTQLHHPALQAPLLKEEGTAQSSPFQGGVDPLFNRGDGVVSSFLMREEEGVFSAKYYMQLDIKTFFPSIDRKILSALAEGLIRKAVNNSVWTEEMLRLAKRIIFHDAASDFYYKGDSELKALVPKEKSLIYQKQGKGLPIGNYTSQFFANLYLNEVDQYIKRILKCKYYVRYVDDLVIIGFADADFEALKKSINYFLREKLELVLNAKKSRIRPVANGIDFLGYFFKADHMLARRKVIGRMNKKLFSPMINNEKKNEIIASYFAHFKRADAWALAH